MGEVSDEIITALLAACKAAQRRFAWSQMTLSQQLAVEKASADAGHRGIVFDGGELLKPDAIHAMIDAAIAKAEARQ